MRSGLSIGRIFGIDLTIDWSWSLIFLLLVWYLGGVVLAQAGWSLAQTWSLALVAALLFFASVLAHEVAHALVARAQGLPVRNITLFLFGGVATIQREPASPRREVLLALVGPLTSLVLGALLLWWGRVSIGLLGTGAAAPGFLLTLSPLSVLLLWLGQINLALGLFNLLPGFPLDGGRVLRALLWATTHSLRTATRWASWAGQACGWLLIGAGLVMIVGLGLPFLGTGLLSGVWLAILGWFLRNAALHSYRRVVAHDVLTGVPVARLMHAPLPPIPADMTVSTLVQDRLLGTEEQTVAVSADGEHLAGVVGVDAVRQVPRAAWESTPVGAIMTPLERVTTVTPQDDAGATLDDLTNREVDQVPVVENGRLVGVLARRDIQRWLALHGESAGIASSTRHQPSTGPS
jgi:Zn-dependent protease/predicted transcriptional regulator